MKTALFGSDDARAYHIILDQDETPLGGADSPYLAQWQARADTLLPDYRHLRLFGTAHRSNQPIDDVDWPRNP